MASILMEVLVDGLIDLWHTLELAFFWLKDENIIVSNHLGLFFLEGPYSKVAEVFLDVNTAPVLEHWDHARQEGKRHAMGVPGWRGLWSVGIDMGVNPDDLGVGHEPLHACDGTDGLRVVSSKDNWEVTLLKGFGRLVSQVHG